MSALHCINCGKPTTEGAGLRCDGCDLIFLRKQRQKTTVKIRERHRAARAGELPADNPGVIRFRSRDVARKAKQRGEIVAQPCACCGDPTAQMHHPDYEEPRLVVWLCAKHHHAWHATQRKILQHLFDGWLTLERSAFGSRPDDLDDADAAFLRELMVSPDLVDVSGGLSIASLFAPVSQVAS